MEKYAVVKIGPFQYVLEAGKEYSVPKFDAEEGKKIDVDQVLAVANGDDLQIGTPFLKGAKVNIEILGQEKGDKVTSRVYKSKSRYRRTKGFRKQVTRFKVGSIKV